MKLASKLLLSILTLATVMPAWAQPASQKIQESEESSEESIAAQKINKAKKAGALSFNGIGLSLIAALVTQTPTPFSTHKSFSETRKAYYQSKISLEMASTKFNDLKSLREDTLDAVQAQILALEKPLVDLQKIEGLDKRKLELIEEALQNTHMPVDIEKLKYDALKLKENEAFNKLHLSCLIWGVFALATVTFVASLIYGVKKEIEIETAKEKKSKKSAQAA